MYVTRNTEARLCSHWFCGWAMSITKPMCVFVTWGIQRAMRMRYLSSVVSPAILYISTLSKKKAKIFEKSYLI